MKIKIDSSLFIKNMPFGVITPEDINNKPIFDENKKQIGRLIVEDGEIFGLLDDGVDFKPTYSSIEVVKQEDINA
jgi:hypothetical protein